MENQKKKICIFIESLRWGGAEKQSLLLAKALKPNHNISVVVLRGEASEKRFTELLNQEQVGLFILRGNPVRKLFEFMSFLKEKKIDILFCYLASNNLYGAIAGKLTGVPYIIGGIRNSEITPVKLVIQKYLHNNLLHSTIFNNYSGEKNLAGRGFNKEKNYVIPNGIELNTPVLKRAAEPTINIVTLSRFVPQKDIFTALKSFHYLVNELLEGTLKIRYILVGYGELEYEIRNRIKALDLSDEVSLVINPEITHSYLKKSHIYLSTSLFEGISNSIMEAMGYSLPIVATDVGDNSCLVEEGVNGYLCQPGRYKEIATKLRELILNPKLRVKMGVGSYEKVQNNFSLDAFKRTYIEFINELD